ncbi:MAG: hypothetical protein ACKOTD_06015, partial [Phycisphaerales bacterium]
MIRAQIHAPARISGCPARPVTAGSDGGTPSCASAPSTAQPMASRCEAGMPAASDIATGTSIDGIDLALVRVAGSGRAIRAETVATRSAGLGDLAPRLRAAATQVPMPAGDFARLALEL